VSKEIVFLFNRVVLQCLLIAPLVVRMDVLQAIFFVRATPANIVVQWQILDLRSVVRENSIPFVLPHDPFMFPQAVSRTEVCQGRGHVPAKDSESSEKATL
jgi:hypothetical protein